MSQDERHPALTGFLSALMHAFDIARMQPEAERTLARIGSALAEHGSFSEVRPVRRPVCRFLADALEHPRAASPALAGLAEAFAALETLLAWRPRAAGGPNASENWPEGHANAVIVGLGGLEERADLMIGVSLLAPEVRYPDHDHKPEEVYLVVTPGRFQHGASTWFEPGVGGTLFNEPNIRHAMASGPTPLLAFWCLWSGKPH